MPSLIRTLTSWTVAAAVVLSGIGCQSTSPRHAAAVDAAKTRWNTTHAELVVSMAQQHFDTGDLEQAQTKLLEALRLDPNSAGLHLLAGRVALEQGRLERSHSRLQRAIELDPRQPAAYYYQGIVLQRWDRNDEALARYRKAYRLQPDNVAALLAIAEMLVATDRVDQAVTLLEKKVRYFDQDAGICVALGQLYALRQQPQPAAAMYAEALLIEPQSITIAEELAHQQLACGRLEQAIETLERLHQKPEIAALPELTRVLIETYRRTQRYSAARALCQRLLDQDPRDVETLIQLGELAWLDNDQGAAMTAARRVMSLAPKRYEGYLLAGMVSQKRRRDTKALRLFDRAAKLAPERADPLILRGITLQRSGQPGAAEAYAEALKRQPADDRAQRLLEALSSATTQGGR
jgi:tetratricopeptide (TPR) repeat protein